jgi:hypothetical protein
LANIARIVSNSAELKTQLQGMYDLSAEMSPRLQMIMDRRSKFIETLSSIMKRIETTQASLVPNLKMPFPRRAGLGEIPAQGSFLRIIAGRLRSTI